jgi:hypothetical protein
MPQPPDLISWIESLAGAIHPGGLLSPYKPTPAFRTSRADTPTGRWRHSLGGWLSLKRVNSAPNLQPHSYARIAAQCTSIIIAFCVTIAPLASASVIVPRDPVELLVRQAEATSYYGTTMAAAPTGEFMLVWMDSLRSWDVSARRFRADGTPLGPQFQVNTNERSDAQHPSVALDATGNAIIAWTATTIRATAGGNQAGERDVYLRRFNADGSPRDIADVRVNTITAGAQTSVSVAADAAGNFVVVWDNDGPAPGIMMRRYNADGTPRDAVEHVVAADGSQVYEPETAMDEDGDFVVTWHGAQMSDIRARRFTAAGVPRDAEALSVNVTTQYAVSQRVAMDAAGNFVVAWLDFPGTSYTVYFRRYAADGTPRDTTELPAGAGRIDSGGYDRRLALAVAPAGGFALLWEGLPSDTTPRTIYARRFAADGAPRDPAAFRITASGLPEYDLSLAVTLRDDGTMTTAWTATLLYLRRFGPDGSALDADRTRVVNLPTGPVNEPQIAIAPDGTFVVSWAEGDWATSYGPKTIRARRFSANGEPLDAAPLVVTAGTPRYRAEPSVAIASDHSLFVTWHEFPTPSVPLHRVFARRFTPAGLPREEPFPVAPDSVGDQISPSVAVDASGSFVVVFESWTSLPVRTSTILARRFPTDGPALDAPFPISTLPALLVDPIVALNEEGDMAVSWLSHTGNTADSTIFVRRFTASDQPVDPSPVRVSLETAQNIAPSIAGDAEGNFVVAYQSYGRESDRMYFESNIYARRFSADGSADSPADVRVNVITAGSQSRPSVAMDAAGSYVIAWESDAQGNEGIYARRFAADGTPLGGEFSLNTVDNQPIEPQVAISQGSPGDFVASWTTADDEQIVARRFTTPGSVQASYSEAVPIVVGGAATPLTIELTQTPRSEVIITLTPSGQQLDLGAGPGAPQQMRFPANLPPSSQTVELRAVASAGTSLPPTATLTLSVSSTDPAYAPEQVALVVNGTPNSVISFTLRVPEHRVFLPVLVDS